MDLYATLAQPLAAVFHHMAAPEHLGDWLVEVVGVEAGMAWQPGVGAEFALTLCADGRAVAATGEVVAYEPPWLAAYRICVGGHSHVVRIACTVSGGATHLHVHQGDGNAPLAVNLARLARSITALETWGAEGEGG
jgi:uncharacterized protein YndB with AHSA1/START domain